MASAISCPLKPGPQKLCPTPSCQPQMPHTHMDAQELFCSVTHSSAYKMSMSIGGLKWVTYTEINYFDEKRKEVLRWLDRNPHNQFNPS